MKLSFRLLAPGGGDLSAMQRLRGRVFLEIGAIAESQLDAAGRHVLEDDHLAWHLLLMHESAVVGCMRYLLCPVARVTFEDLRISETMLAKDVYWGPILRDAVEAEMAVAWDQGIGFAELGGWAIDARHRCTAAALRMLLASYAMAGVVGDHICVAQTNASNHAASILRRMGGTKLGGLPIYADVQYCGGLVLLLRFDSRVVPVKYRRAVAAIQKEFVEPPARIELATTGLRNRCSTN